MDAAVDDRLFHGLKSLFSSHNQFAQGQNEIGFQGNGIVLLGVIAVDVHGVDILGGGWADLDDLTFQPRHQRRIFGFGVADNDVVTGGEEGIRNLTLCRKGLAGTGGAQNQTVGVLELLSVNHNQVVGKRVQTIVKGFLSILKQLLGGERNENCRAGGGHAPLNLDLVISQRQRGHQPLLLLVVQPPQIAVVLLGNGVGLKDIGFQLLLGAAGVENQESEQEHTLILGLEFFQQRFGIIAVGGEVGRNDVHVIAGADSLFLLLNLAAIQFRDGVLDLPDGLVLIDGLDVHGHDFAGIHVQEVLQQLVADIGSGDL